MNQIHGAHRDFILDFTLDDIQVKLDMLYVPPAKFIMGSPEDEPLRSPSENQFQTQVSDGFWISKTLVSINKEPQNFLELDWDDAISFCKKTTRLKTKELTNDYIISLPTELHYEFSLRKIPNIKNILEDIWLNLPNRNKAMMKRFDIDFENLLNKDINWPLESSFKYQNEWCFDRAAYYPERDDSLMPFIPDWIGNNEENIHFSGEDLVISRGGNRIAAREYHGKNDTKMGFRLCIRKKNKWD